MGRRRALLTSHEREIITKTNKDNSKYVAISRIRTKIQDELPEDIQLLRENHPDLYEELQEVVCEDNSVDEY